MGFYSPYFISWWNACGDKVGVRDGCCLKEIGSIIKTLPNEDPNDSSTTVRVRGTRADVIITEGSPVGEMRHALCGGHK